MSYSSTDAMLRDLFAEVFNGDPTRFAACVAIAEDQSGGAIGMQAQLASVGNRAAQPGWWGTDILSVLKARDQYDCLMLSSPAYRQFLNAPFNPLFPTALALAGQLVAGTLDDITKGADSYFAVGSRRPAWATGARYHGTFGGQAFYRVGVNGKG